ncbi:MAG: hydroxyisourate hydrolase [Pyrinomonadaceae bacterium]
MSGITTHVLDTSIGRAAGGVKVKLECQSRGADWEVLSDGVTDDDGRLRLDPQFGHIMAAGQYRLTFDTGSYFALRSIESFYPMVTVTFNVRKPSNHYHVPLLLSPFGFSTYRGT